MSQRFGHCCIDHLPLIALIPCLFALLTTAQYYSAPMMTGSGCVATSNKLYSHGVRQLVLVVLPITDGIKKHQKKFALKDLMNSFFRCVEYLLF